MIWNAKSSGRIAWIDALKMFAMFLVVFGHCNSIQQHSLIGYDYINQLIVAFNMPVFVFLSGLVCYRSLKKICSWQDFLCYERKISERIALPSVCFSCLVGFFLHLSSEDYFRSFSNVCVLTFFLLLCFFKEKNIIVDKFYNWVIFVPLVLNFCGKYSYFWFLSMLLFVTSSTALTVYLARKCGLRKYWIVGLVSYLIMLLTGGSPNNTEEMMPYFLIGCFFAKKKIFGKCDLGLIPFTVTCLLMLALGFCLFESYYDHDFYRYNLMVLLENDCIHEYFIRIVCAMSFIVLLCLFFMKFYKNYGFVALLGTDTLAFYMIHAQIVRFLRSYITFSSNEWYMWFVALCVALATVLVSYFIILFFQHWRISKIIFLGKN